MSATVQLAVLTDSRRHSSASFSTSCGEASLQNARTAPSALPCSAA